MRILSICGENLASLAAPFDPEPAGESLGTTGMFAINGETVAEKSTTLDAFCLACAVGAVARPLHRVRNSAGP